MTYFRSLRIHIWASKKANIQCSEEFVWSELSRKSPLLRGVSVFVKQYFIFYLFIYCMTYFRSLRIHIWAQFDLHLYSNIPVVRSQNRLP
jgi:hypothetical protein